MNSVLKTILVGIGLLMLYAIFRQLARRWYIFRYSDVDADSIHAQISETIRNRSQLRGSLTLSAKGLRLVHIKDIALGELAEQLREWIAVIDDDKKCREFSFYLDNEPETVGLLRIIPRPVGWQICSIRLRTRTTKPISLKAHITMARSIVDQVSLIS